MNAARPIETKPLTGALDFRTPVDQLSPDQFRWRENFTCDQKGQIIRQPGFSAYGTGNADYHDQLLPLQTYYAYRNPRVPGDDSISPLPNASYCGTIIQTLSNGREPVIFGYSARLRSGGTRLMIGTESRLLVLDQTTGNYRIIADGYGTPELKSRWNADILNDTVILTNGIDVPLAWVVDSQPVGCQLQSALPVSDAGLVGLSRTAYVKQFEGVMLYMDVTMDGVRYPNRILWSDEDLPQSLNPASNNGASVAGFFDLPPGQIILGAVVFSSAIYIFTDKGICRGVTTGSTPIFDFSTFVYSDESGNKCLAYPRTLCQFGAYFFFAGADGFYVYNPYQMEPERLEWMHQASGIVYEGAGGYLPINPQDCLAHHAIFKPDVEEDTADAAPSGEGEIWLSYAEMGQSEPSKTIVLNTRFNVASTMDAGFGMFVDHIEDDTVSFRDFLLENCISTPDSLAYFGIGFVKEGQPETAFPCPPEPQGFVPTSIYQPVTADVWGTGILSEDFNQASPDADSLCAFLMGMTLADVCLPCEGPRHFIGSSMIDWCLKELNDGYAREICTNVETATGPGTPYQNLNGFYVPFPAVYAFKGYFSTMRSGPQGFGVQFFKQLSRFKVNCFANEQTIPCALQLRVGMSYNPADPNLVSNYGVIWRAVLRKLLENPGLSPAEYLARNLIPNVGIEFPLYQRGVWLYWELAIGNLANPADLSSALQPATGGASQFSAIYQTVREVSEYVK